MKFGKSFLDDLIDVQCIAAYTGREKRSYSRAHPPRLINAITAITVSAPPQ